MNGNGAINHVLAKYSDDGICFEKNTEVYSSLEQLAKDFNHVLYQGLPKQHGEQSLPQSLPESGNVMLVGGFNNLGDHFNTYKKCKWKPSVEFKKFSDLERTYR